ncbi:MAG: hypothetical protein SAK29_17730 [Scytonema sp. PMC 1069.18]|nr:hypothetical protein [Scytonema sp. PMC 1069.18]MEC4884928.1 hypothetical protein [Scytonema sp. PMC 1070.18]
MGNERDVWILEVDAALREWCQGDCVVGEHWFLYRFNPQRPLTSDSANLAQEEKVKLQPVFSISFFNWSKM